MGWDIDLVCPVPDGSRPAAIQISSELGLPYREGLVKNRYVGRTFIMPDQRLREVRAKPFPIEPCRLQCFSGVEQWGVEQWGVELWSVDFGSVHHAQPAPA
jgi:hypothetical protein